MTRDFSKDVIPKGGPVKPYVCEYLYGQILREVEGKSKPLVTLIHVSLDIDLIAHTPRLIPLTQSF